MGLSHLKPIVDTVNTAGGSFAVRGLSLDDIVPIFTAYQEPMSALYEQIKGADIAEALNSAEGLAASAAQMAPGILAAIIAAATDEPDVSLAAGLPMPAQLDALEKIAKLTFATMSPKKVLEIVIRIANATSETVAEIGPSLLGSGT